MIALPARADLLSIDLNTPGDGLVTRDTVNNLDWLNLNLTKNLSYNEVLSGAGGWSANGWRHASTEEVCALLANFLGSIVGCDQFFSTEAPVSAADAFFSFLGQTGTVGEADLATGLYRESGALAGSVFGVAADRTDGIARFTMTTGNPDDSNRIGGGQLLVRSTIPEPSTGVLSMLGLLQLGWWRRQSARDFPHWRA